CRTSAQSGSCRWRRRRRQCPGTPPIRHCMCDVDGVPAVDDVALDHHVPAARLKAGYVVYLSGRGVKLVA
ncbi:hypothetical protein PFISCL1PPCAC_13858, partial [Pristionchus fissidentatus]